jgi:hypothetical protein
MRPLVFATITDDAILVKLDRLVLPVLGHLAIRERPEARNEGTGTERTQNHPSPPTLEPTTRSTGLTGNKQRKPQGYHAWNT